MFSSKRSKSGKKTIGYGIDIGNSSVKYVQLGKGIISNKIMVTDCGMIAFSQKAIAQPREREQEFADILNKIASEKNLSAGVYVSVPAQEVKSVLLDLPDMPKQELTKAIGWALSQEGEKIELEDYTYDYLPVTNLSKEKNNLNSYFTVAVRKRSTMHLVNLFETSNVTINAIDIAPMAEMAALEMAGYISRDNKVTLVLSVRNNRTILSVVCNGEIYFLRNISVGGMSFTSSLQKSLGIGFEEEEEIKMKAPESVEVIAKKEEEVEAVSPDDIAAVLGTAPPRPRIENTEVNPSQSGEKTRERLIESALRENFETLVQNIERDFKFFSFQVSRSVVQSYDKVIVIGGGASLKALPKYLSERLGVEVEVASIFDKIKLSPEIAEKYDKEYLESISPRMITAVGLAQRGLKL